MREGGRQNRNCVRKRENEEILIESERGGLRVIDRQTDWLIDTEKEQSKT